MQQQEEMSWDPSPHWSVPFNKYLEWEWVGGTPNIPSMLLTHKHSSFPGFGFLASAPQEQAAGYHPQADPPNCSEPFHRTETRDERKALPRRVILERALGHQSTWYSTCKKPPWPSPLLQHCWRYLNEIKLMKHLNFLKEGYGCYVIFIRWNMKAFWMTILTSEIFYLTLSGLHYLVCAGLQLEII